MEPNEESTSYISCIKASGSNNHDIILTKNYLNKRRRVQQFEKNYKNTQLPYFKMQSRSILASFVVLLSVSFQIIASQSLRMLYL